MTDSPGGSREAFQRLYHAEFKSILAYAVRRTESADDAADVVSSTFLVAWRRGHEVPAGDEARLWLYGVARHVLANHGRSVRRQARLGERLRQRLAESTLTDPGIEVTDRLLVQSALAQLSDEDREVLTLSIWEGLAPREIAEVVGMEPQAVRTRLFRAKGRLRALLGNETELGGHVLAVRRK